MLIPPHPVSTLPPHSKRHTNPEQRYETIRNSGLTTFFFSFVDFSCNPNEKPPFSILRRVSGCFSANLEAGVLLSQTAHLWTLSRVWRDETIDVIVSTRQYRQKYFSDGKHLRFDMHSGNTFACNTGLLFLPLLQLSEALTPPTQPSMHTDIRLGDHMGRLCLDKLLALLR